MSGLGAPGAEIQGLDAEQTLVSTGGDKQARDPASPMGGAGCSRKWLAAVVVYWLKSSCSPCPGRTIMYRYRDAEASF
jgi:hypothetical protein